MGMNDPVRVKLSDHELAERAQIMAAKLEHVSVLRRKKSEDAKATQALIDSDLDELAAMSRVILEAEEDARQGDLFADGTLTGLSAGIAERCTCEGGPEAEAKDPACALHGVERNADGTARDSSVRVVHEASCASSPDGETGEPSGPCDCGAEAQAVEQLAGDLEAAGIGEPNPERATAVGDAA